MMNILSAESIAKTFSEKWLFRNINFGMSAGDKIALVGINGTGKSTFLKILAGLIPADEGSVSIRKGIKVCYLNQNPQFAQNSTALDAIFDAQNPILEAVKNYERLLPLAESQPEAFSQALQQMDNLNAWDYEVKIKEIMSKLGIYQFAQRYTQEMSGGQRKRLALAQALLAEPDLLILDEPTNHLDLDAIEWLEDKLAQSSMSLLLVTHDRYFLDRITNQIIELDEGKLFRYEGNYTDFLEAKSTRLQVENTEVTKAQNLMRREIEWIRRMPKARGTKAKYRVDAFEDLKDKATNKRSDATVQINLQTQRMGKKILEVEDLCHHYDDLKTVDTFSYVFKRGDRIGIVGKNGIGKSTFLSLLVGELQAKSGKIDKGENTKFGFYTQNGLVFDEQKRVIDVVKEVAEVIQTADGATITVSQLLNLFMFPPHRQYDIVAKLSGGERKRLQLVRVLMENPNFLILDEPTNDLDIQTLNVLEEFLENFSACLLIVSHDRYFMDKLVEHLFVFEGEGKIRDFAGNYTDFRNEQEEIQAAEQLQKAQVEKKVTPTQPTISKDKPKTKLSFKEQKEFETLEKEIPTLEAKKAEIVQYLSDGSTDFEKIALWSKQIEDLSKQIEQKTDRWLELSEFL